MAISTETIQADRIRHLERRLLRCAELQVPDVINIAVAAWSITASYHRIEQELAKIPQYAADVASDASFAAFDDGLRLGLAMARTWPTDPQSFGAAWLLEAMDAAGLELGEVPNAAR